MGAPLVVFYFDLISPYAWLAAPALERIEAAGARVQCQPVLFAGLLNAHGTSGPAEIAVKRRYMFRDVMRQAALLGLPFAGPPAQPFNPLLALRMCSAVTDEAPRRALMRALMACCWQEGGDITEPATVARVADACGQDGAALLTAAGEQRVKLQLAAATTEAIAADVFGVPTFCLGDELFWGGDRIDALLARLAGQRIDDMALNRFLARPGSAHRTVR